MRIDENGVVDLDYEELDALVAEAMARQGPPVTVEEEEETLNWLRSEADRAQRSQSSKGD